MSAETEQLLRVRLDVPLPREIAIGGGSALFVCGSCFHPQRRITELWLVLDGEEQAVHAHSMPRLDLLRSLHPRLDVFSLQGVQRDEDSGEDPLLHSYLSGFWGVVELRPGPGALRELQVRARLQDGAVLAAPLATLRVGDLQRAAPIAAPGSEEGPLVAICMATYEPPGRLLRRQLESIREQTHTNWICVISDDCSSPRSFAALQAEVAGDPRFVVSRSARRLGFYLNFERALSMAPRGAPYVALADQDDRWYPEKLATLLDRIGSAELIYSDARLIDEAGDWIADSYWTARRNNHTDLLSLLVANSVTGAASLFRRDLLDDALPFPPAQFAHFHDHWIGLVALARGEIAFVDRPLYDYVQHGAATLGHAAANRMRRLRERIGSLRADPRERVRMWRLHYFVDVARLEQVAAIIELRLGDRMSAGKRRALQGFLDADHSLPALGRLWARGARELLGAPQTLGAEWMLAYAFTWRRLLSASARQRPTRGLRLDAVPPPDLVMAPGRQISSQPAVRELSEKIAPLALSVSDEAPARVNLLIPTIDIAHFFGGYIGKFNLARRLAERGCRVRIVTVDPVGSLPGDWRERIERYSGLAGVFGRVELAFGREAGGLEVSREDRFIATTWWTAHIAEAAVGELELGRFLYLIQEYEPFTFAMSSHAALAAASYEFPHTALFSTELLRAYFRRHRIGVYRDGGERGEALSESFQNAITSVRPPSVAELSARGTRRLLFYARPEPHAARNLFELGVMGIMAAARSGTLEGWQLHGIGSIGGSRSLHLDGGLRLQMMPRSEQSSYADLLRDHDVGLALMYTPHPSLVPIEMASAGMLTVTNSFENKSPQELTRISSNLITAAPTVPAVAAAIEEAVEAVGRHEDRVRGAAVRWSQDWDASFPEGLIDRVIALLRG